MCVYVRACVYVRVRACVRACVCVCVRARARAIHCNYKSVGHMTSINDKVARNPKRPNLQNMTMGVRLVGDKFTSSESGSGNINCSSGL